MSLSTLYIYETAHGSDPVETHLEEFRQWGINPGFIGLELPDDGDPFKRRNLVKRSPGTGIALCISFKLQELLRKSSASNASRSDSEYEAGRRFADEIGASCENIDRNRATFYREYTTWRRRLWDIILLAGAVITGLFALFFTVILITGFLDSTFSIGAALWSLLIVGVFAIGTFLLFSSIVSGFQNGIRQERDEWMFQRTREWCNKQDIEAALIIAGKAHSSGLTKLAKENNTETYSRSAPSVQKIDGESLGLKDIKMLYLDD